VQPVPEPAFVGIGVLASLGVWCACCRKRHSFGSATEERVLCQRELSTSCIIRGTAGSFCLWSDIALFSDGGLAYSSSHHRPLRAVGTQPASSVATCVKLHKNELQSIRLMEGTDRLCVERSRFAVDPFADSIRSRWYAAVA
jgi:hypothetical protein